MAKYWSIQYLRAIAAVMVVAVHLFTPARGIVFPSWHSEVGGSGVDIFFVISGFIIYTSQALSQHSAPEFAYRRIVRVMPLYWLVTVALILLHVVAGMAADLSLQPAHVVQSFLLIPHFSPSAPDHTWPLLIPGWTLQYEMFFYSVFAVLIAAGIKRLGVALVVCMAVLVAAGLLIHPTGALGRVYTNPLLLEFSAGVIIGATTTQRPTLLVPSLAWLAPVGALLLACSDIVTLPRVVEWGAPAVMLVVGCLAWERARKPAPLRWLAVLGDASYSLYLTHTITLSLVREIWRRMVPTSATPLMFAGFAIACIATSIAVGLASYYLVEKPALRILSRALTRNKKPSLATEPATS
ncbi:acyltransferase family protein [Caulobacter segnis]